VLDVQPGECVVIEDSQAGVSAGLAAGAAVLGVPTMQAVAPAPGLTVLDSLTGVDAALLHAVLGGLEVASA
jgi:beta-phosphoglucomutase-like phosphatase (HAD superfamily)